MRRTAIIALLALAATAGIADGRIVVQRSIAGIALDATPQQVREKLGEPSSQRTVQSEFGPMTEYRYRAKGLRISFHAGGEVERAVLVDVTRGGERTREGIGVGSSEHRLRKKLKGEKCKTEFGRRHCWFGSFRAGRTVTDFFIAKGKVTRVSLGRVLD